MAFIFPFKIAAYILHIYSTLAVYFCSISVVKLQHCCSHATFLPFNFNAVSINVACFKYVNLCCKYDANMEIMHIIMRADAKKCIILLK